MGERESNALRPEMAAMVRPNVSGWWEVGRGKGRGGGIYLHEAGFKQEIVYDGINVLSCFILLVLQVTAAVCSN